MKSKYLFNLIVSLITLQLLVSADRSPTIAYISQEQIKDIGGSVELVCVMHDASKYSRSWNKFQSSTSTEPFHISNGPHLLIKESRFEVKVGNDESTYTLKIHHLEETDAGTYKCQIAVNNDKITAEVRLQIRMPPIIYDNSTRAIVTTEGSAVKLECYAGGHPRPMISWRRDNNEVLPTGRSIHRGNTLNIDYITKDHHGIYYCVAENGVGQGVRRNIDVEVQFAPVVTATRKRVSQALGYDMDLECKVEAYPPPAIVWTKDGNQITNNQHDEVAHATTSDQVTTTTVRVITIEKNQYGNYTCLASNIYGDAKAQVELFESTVPMCPPACGGISSKTYS